MADNVTVTPFTEKQIEILNDLLRYSPERRNWEQGIQDVGGPGSPNTRGLGTILDEMNRAANEADRTAIVTATVSSPSDGEIATLQSGSVVRVIGIKVTEAFDDLSSQLTIGTDADPDEIATFEFSDLAKADTYVVIPNDILASAKTFKYFLTPASATKGRLEIVFTFGRC